MIYEEVIAYRIRIATKGMRYFFQVPLPKDTKRIIGIETSCQFINPANPPQDKSSELYLQSYPNDNVLDTSTVPPMPLSWKYINTGLFGDLKLSVSHAADVFYSERIVTTDYWTAILQDPMVNLWAANPFMNLGKREEMVLDVHPGMGIVEGCFTDADNPYYPPYDLKVFIRADVDHRMEV